MLISNLENQENNSRMTRKTLTKQGPGEFESLSNRHLECVHCNDTIFASNFMLSESGIVSNKLKWNKLDVTNEKK